jgi:hypothetical protein
MRSGHGTRVIALYLPQFHPIPENDRWWGDGFTEWRNVARARPMFRGHYQPHIPADLGFYDLRLPETRAAQAALAQAYGIEAFCYWHYWFAGRRILERPFAEVLASGAPAFPFCLAWANHSWSGIWDNAPHRLLIQQSYPGLEDHRSHFRALLPAFSDPRHVTVDGKPLFTVFLPMQIPEVKAFTDTWRELAHQAGLKGLHLVGMTTDECWLPQDHGFDASVVHKLPRVRGDWVSWRRPLTKLRVAYERWRGLPTVYAYDDVQPALIADAPPGIEAYPCLVPNWDNTPRCGPRGLVLHGSRPESFRFQVRRALAVVAGYPDEHHIVFVKSWNEWAEGNHLEPDLRDGRGYLEAIRSEVTRIPSSTAAGRLR